MFVVEVVEVAVAVVVSSESACVFPALMGVSLLHVAHVGAITDQCLGAMDNNYRARVKADFRRNAFDRVYTAEPASAVLAGERI